MTIYLYSVPAILALILKTGILYLSQHAEVQNFQTRLFSAAVVASVAMSMAEVSGLQRFFETSPYYEALLYYAAHIIMVALLAHLAVLITFDDLNRRWHLVLGIALYSYAVLLEVLLFFSSQLITGFRLLQGYTATRIPGPLLWIYEVFMAACVLTILIVPFWGFRKGRPPVARCRNKLWIVSAFPFGLLFLVIISLLHFQIYLFNASVTTPLLITFLLAAVGYATHSRRVVDLSFYLPGSRARKLKNAFYSKIAALTHEIPQINSIKRLLDRLAEILRCPVAVFGSSSPTVIASDDKSRISSFPTAKLAGVDQMLVAGEIRDSCPQTHGVMAEYEVAVVIPFFPQSNRASCWLLLGEPFSQQVYTPQDFRAIEGLSRKLASLFLDKMLESSIGLDRPQAEKLTAPREQTSLDADVMDSYAQPAAEPNTERSFKQVIAEFEARVIGEALKRCNGNQAETARILGLRPNTLHYKIERYRLKNEKRSKN